LGTAVKPKGRGCKTKKKKPLRQLPEFLRIEQQNGRRKKKGKRIKLRGSGAKRERGKKGPTGEALANKAGLTGKRGMCGVGQETGKSCIGEHLIQER